MTEKGSTSFGKFAKDINKPLSTSDFELLQGNLFTLSGLPTADDPFP
jgi:hypothetical protein